MKKILPLEAQCNCGKIVEKGAYVYKSFGSYVCYKCYLKEAEELMKTRRFAWKNKFNSVDAG